MKFTVFNEEFAEKILNDIDKLEETGTWPNFIVPDWAYEVSKKVFIGKISPSSQAVLYAATRAVADFYRACHKG